ncbi:hypothetical protein [Streptomyces sp. NPDC020965]|uniref:hypothetical protein n=1 Tax=Streptomyces sp. NPDC020965 TaxID=3365105 RepID=UPI003797F35D
MRNDLVPAFGTLKLDQPAHQHIALDRLHRLSEEASVPRVTVHDLRHLAATITITAGVPLTVGLQDAAALHPVDDREPLQPPHPKGSAPGRRHH